MQKIDTELILAFIEGSLDKDTENQVRKMIDSSESWFVEYMELKQAIDSAGEFVSQEEVQTFKFKESKKEKEFAFPFIPSFTRGALVETNSGMISFGIACFVILTTFVFFQLNTTNSSSLKRQFYEGQNTSIEFSQNEITVINNYEETVNVSVVLPSISQNPSYEYLEFDSFIKFLNSKESKTITMESINNFYDLEPGNNLNVRVIVFTSLRQTLQDQEGVLIND